MTAAPASAASSATPSATRLYPALSPGAVNCKPAGLREAMALAKHHGFGGVEFNPREVVTIEAEQGAGTVRGWYEAAGLKPAGFGLPVDWRGDEYKWRAGLQELPALAKTAASLGCKRCMTWIPPSSDEREYDDNRRFHVDRFRPAAE